MELEEYYFGKKVLLLGGAGFIGSNLAKEFVDFNATVTIIDGGIQNTGANRLNIQCLMEKIILYNIRIENLECLPELIEEADLIIDSMALISHNYGVEFPIIDTQINLMSHLYLMNALKKARNKKLIYLGSRGQYGNIRKRVILEGTPQNPIDPQGINKAAAESFFRFYGKKYGFKVLSLRITNCFGENQRVNNGDIGLVGAFIRDILLGKTVEVYGNKKRRKNILYVKDLVKIVLKLIMTNFNEFEAYNVAGVDVSLESLLNNIVKIVVDKFTD